MIFILSIVRQNAFFLLLFLFSSLAGVRSLHAQCTTTSIPSFTHSCLNEYFTSITASGTGVTSTIAVTGSSCTGTTYFNYFGSQGVTANVGTTVYINVSRFTTTYISYVSVYVDWNNNGSYDSTELAGTLIALPYTTLSTIDSFVVPSCGVVTGTNLHMRVMLAEAQNGAGAPCTARYGQACDFYMNVGCTSPPAVTATPTSPIICPGGSGVALTASGGGTGTVYLWSPSSGLSTASGATVTANPAATTVYTVSICSACGSSTATDTVKVATISGPTTVCTFTTFMLSDAIGGGTWSSGSTLVTVLTAGSVFANYGTGGVAVISYQTPGGCISSTSVTINVSPNAIFGFGSWPNVCAGGTLLATSTTPGDVWSSSNTSVATISTSGLITGITSGSTVISYSNPLCTVTAAVNVNPLPAAVTGPSSVCAYGNITLSDATSGGTWSSGNTTKATVDPTSGVVTGVSAGAATITYTSSAGCIAVTTVTVNSPAVITGPIYACTGSTRTLSDATGGGVWSTSNTAIATITAFGVVSGVSAGSVNITYTAGGCFTTMPFTVYQMPTAITGPSAVCIGSNIILSDAVAGGTWSSTLSRATVNATTGVVTGASAGAVTISYSTGGNCAVTTTVTVNTTPSIVVVNSNICTGSTRTYTSFPTGGVWSSSNISVATVSGGVVTGVSAGTVNISYTISLTGCSTFFTANIYTTPTAITGPSAVCVGANITLSDAVAGGTWSSSNPLKATVSPTGVVYAVNTPSATINYNSPGGCSVSKSITINAMPAAITGSSSVCTGTTIALSDITTGGAWSSSSTPIATVSSGVVTGVSAGTTTISYTVSGCSASKSITVSLMPGRITGPSTVCTGLNISLSDISAGGTWSSSSNSIATVTSSGGVVHGVAAGSVRITYTLGGGCFVMDTITVSTSPSAILSGYSLCSGSTFTYSAPTPTGGIWSSNNTSIATISTSGVVTALSSGTVTMSYTVGSCSSSGTVIIFRTPGPITGSSTVCTGSSIALSDTTTGGTWSSNNPSAATISSTGIVTGLSAGTTVIAYTVSGCSITTTITVHTMPGLIAGTDSVCAGLSISLSDAVSGGTWSSSNITFATVDPTSGTVYSLSPGIDTIHYTTGGGCTVTKVVVVKIMPAAITGGSSVNVGFSITLSDTTPSGIWSTSDPAIVTISSSGLATGISSGSQLIFYTIAGCQAILPFTVNP